MPHGCRNQLQQLLLRLNFHEDDFLCSGFSFILLLMWALGMISSYTFGGAIHLLLVFALIVLVIRSGAGPQRGLIESVGLVAIQLESKLCISRFLPRSGSVPDFQLS